jgi:hypothetical protein
MIWQKVVVAEKIGWKELKYFGVWALETAMKTIEEGEGVVGIENGSSSS